MLVRRFAALALVSTLAACKTVPPEPDEPKASDPSHAAGIPSAASGASLSATTPTPTAPTAATPVSATDPALGGGTDGDDPLHGNFTLADATKDLKGTGAIIAKIDTSKGAIQCKMLDDKAPNTVANFVGLARGIRPWKDPNTGKWVKKPAYDGTTFHRIIKGFMIQGGDPRGDGTGEPGYVIKDEYWEGGKHDRAGLLCMANRGPNTNGAQFFITDASAPHLDSRHTYTIFGDCTPVETVHDIANVPTGDRDKPLQPVVIKTVTVTREKGGK